MVASKNSRSSNLSKTTKNAKFQRSSRRNSPQVHALFLSHIAEESSLAVVLKDWIESTFAGQCEVFVSSSGKDLIPGDNWLDEVENALSQTEVFIVLCSPQSINRPWVNFETGGAWIKSLRILPICHSRQTKDRLPQPFIRFQAIQLSDDDFAKNLIQSLATYFQISNLPRIPYDQMLGELRQAETSLPKFPADQGVSLPAESQSNSSESSTAITVDTSRLASRKSQPLLRVILTTGLTQDNAPINSVKGFSINDQPMYIYIKWFALEPNKDHRFAWQLIDDSGDIVNASEVILHPTSAKWNSWHWYSFRKNIDSPGAWIFRGYLEGEKIIEKKFEVRLL